MKLYCGMYDGHAYVVGDDKAVVYCEERDEEEFKKEMLGSTGVSAVLDRRFPMATLVWAEANHPFVKPIMEEYLAEQEPSEEDRPLTPEELALLKKGHQCSTCALSPVCGVAVAIQHHEQRGGGVVVSACRQWIRGKE